MSHFSSIALYTFSSSYVPPAFPPGLPLYYTNPSNASSYPGTGTTVFDLSSNGNNGTLTNGVTWVSGSTSYFDLDDTSQQYITYGDIGDTYGSFTQVTWVWFDTNSGAAKNIVSKWDDTGNNRSWMTYNEAGGIYSYWDRSGNFSNQVNAASGSVFSTSTWYMVTTTYDASSGDCKTYVNNNLKLSTSFGSSGNLYNSTAPLINGHQPLAGRYLDGRIGWSFLWKSVLDSGSMADVWDTTKVEYGY